MPMRSRPPYCRWALFVNSYGSKLNPSQLSASPCADPLFAQCIPLPSVAHLSSYGRFWITCFSKDAGPQRPKRE